MKVRIYSKDTPKGQELDWPAISREGYLVRVARVMWHVDTDGAPIDVELQLTF